MSSCRAWFLVPVSALLLNHVIKCQITKEPQQPKSSYAGNVLLVTHTLHFSKKCRNDGKPLATLIPIGPARETNPRPLVL